MSDLPRIISVDDHVIEAADLWVRRVSSKYRDVAPRLVRGPGVVGFFRLGERVFEEREGLPPCDYWTFGDVRMPVTRSFAAVGDSGEALNGVGITGEVGITYDDIGITYDDMQPGCLDPASRLEDMDQNGVEASLCFPNLLPRFAGQTFLETPDKDLALECVRAYNDWVVEEWCGDSRGRLLPLCLSPLWDARLAAAEIRRNAARGVHAVTFAELPTNLGLPSIHDRDRYWDPFFEACHETSTVLCMHIGSSGLPSTSADAPVAVVGSTVFTYAMYSMADWLFSGVFERFPGIKIAYAEADIGWIPTVLEHADRKWENNPNYYDARHVTRPPSAYYYDHVFGCFISDRHGLKNIAAVGENNIMFEVDYPHADTTWPNSLAVAEKELDGLTKVQMEKVLRGNAITLLGLAL